MPFQAFLIDISMIIVTRKPLWMGIHIMENTSVYVMDGNGGAKLELLKSPVLIIKLYLKVPAYK